MTSTKKSFFGRNGIAILAFVAFIALGLPDGLLGVGWPSIRATFGIPLDSMGLLLFSATVGYLTAAFFNGKLISRFGVGVVLAASCALTGLHPYRLFRIPLLVPDVSTGFDRWSGSRRH